MLKKTPQYAQLKEAMDIINELNVPEHLQEKALAHLLSGAGGSDSPSTSTAGGSEKPGAPSAADTGSSLRDYVSKYKPKGAVEEIPALLYWAKDREKALEANEDGIVELYRRAGIRPPKHVSQSMRDLSSKKYRRLDAVAGKAGFVALSRTGEDFVLHDLFKRNVN